ncbi:MAG: type II toxin-antitoxin system RelE/ParE family toxin [Candidatus Aureabacteria bacterium]|nr:type II toxin-antitoxin system RelE/ParE family toxin [Candidatus Auribacterota bacterium]
MKYAIDFADEAEEDLEGYRPFDRIVILDLIEKHLRHEPTRESKSRIKALRGLLRPQYRLRVGNTRIFYDVRGNVVEVIAVVTKSEASRWLKREGLQAESEDEK